MKYLLGVLIGILILLALLFANRKILNPHYQLTIPEFVLDTSKKRPSNEDIIAIRDQLLTLEEKSASVNKRLDDVLIFGGIIITLLLAINIGVFVNVDKEVDKHLRDNFETHRKKIIEYSREVEVMVGKIKTELELAENFRKNVEGNNITPI